MLRSLSVARLLGAASLVALAACGDGGPQNILGTVPGARIRFFNFALNAPSVNFYAGDNKITAISSGSCQSTPIPAACTTTGVEATTGTAYGSVGLGGFYSGLQPGNYTFTARIATATDNGVQIVSVPGSLQDGKSYSLYVAGLYDATTKKADAFLIEDPIPSPIDFTVARVRFVNASANAPALQLVAVNQTGGAESPVGSATAYKAASAFVSLPPGVYDLTARNGATGLVTRTGVSFSPGRVYTITLRGDATLPSTGTATNRPFLDNTENR